MIPMATTAQRVNRLMNEDRSGGQGFTSHLSVRAEISGVFGGIFGARARLAAFDFGPARQTSRSTFSHPWENASLSDPNSNAASRARALIELERFWRRAHFSYAAFRDIELRVTHSLEGGMSRKATLTRCDARAKARIELDLS